MFGFCWCWPSVPSVKSFDRRPFPLWGTQRTLTWGCRWICSHHQCTSFLPEAVVWVISPLHPPWTVPSGSSETCMVSAALSSSRFVTNSSTTTSLQLHVCTRYLSFHRRLATDRLKLRPRMQQIVIKTYLIWYSLSNLVTLSTCNIISMYRQFYSVPRMMQIHALHYIYIYMIYI